MVEGGEYGLNFLLRVTHSGSATRRALLLSVVLIAALGLRVAAAFLVQRVVDHGAIPRVCVFPDTEYYWLLATTILHGAPYDIVEWGNIHHYALRTPGYPAFLAACRATLGEQPLAVRLVQAVLGALAVWLVYRLTRQVVSPAEHEPAAWRIWTIPMIAATIAALNPYHVAMSELILSEAVFVPLMLLTLWGLAVLWKPAGQAGSGKAPFERWRAAVTALGTGMSAGAAILTRPSWGLFLPGVLFVWVLQAISSGEVPLRKRAFQGAVVVVLGVVLTMMPWWVRNVRIFGRFVPTAVWFGASLYDGLNPQATGASDMTFLGDPGLRSLDEQGRDAALAQRAIAFARSRPKRVLDLALIKFGRYWSPWPNASEYRSVLLAVASSLLVVPLFYLMLKGMWIQRHDLRTWLLLAGPILYFCVVHLVFVSSIRYRIPAEPAALGLAAIGLRSILDRSGGSFEVGSSEQFTRPRSERDG